MYMGQQEWEQATQEGASKGSNTLAGAQTVG
jgi:hypothetical protein